MEPCQYLETCNFFQVYQSDEKWTLALQGLANMYCKSKKFNECVRLKVSNALGGPKFVPENMMPNGLALSGTDVSNWPKEVTDLLKK